MDRHENLLMTATFGKIRLVENEARTKLSIAHRESRKAIFVLSIGGTMSILVFLGKFKLFGPPFSFYDGF